MLKVAGLFSDGLKSVALEKWVIDGKSVSILGLAGDCMMISRITEFCCRVAYVIGFGVGLAQRLTKWLMKKAGSMWE